VRTASSSIRLSSTPELVLEANDQIIAHLNARTRKDVDGFTAPAGSTTEGTVLLRRESFDHSYPHCWRCRNPLIYMAVSSWFVATTKIRDRMLELNEQVTWVPEHVKARAVREVAGEHPRLVDQPQPVLG
jgi:isoleucyl-tRNA synthetase